MNAPNLAERRMRMTALGPEASVSARRRGVIWTCGLCLLVGGWRGGFG